MDEVVFQRESLRRALLEVVKDLEKAAESYDPEADTPIDDLAAALVAAGLQWPVRSYSQTVADRIQKRAAARKGEA